MCRIAGHLGETLPLTALLRDPPRSLIEQAHSPHELPPGVVGSDGFGVGWFAEHDGAAAFVRSTLPIWVDDLVETMAPHVRSGCVVASSRTASRRMPVARTNTPPFLAGENTLLVHNGTIDDFHARALEPLRALLSREARADIAGNTDTEYVAAVLRDQAAGALEDRVVATLAVVAGCARAAGVGAQLNLIVADGATLVAVRYAVGAATPSLWLREDARGVAVASEPMEPEGWRALPAGVLHVARRRNGRVGLEARSVEE